MVKRENSKTKLINAWVTYDFANSAYNLVITATLFPIYYGIVTSRDLADGTTTNLVNIVGLSVKNTSLYDFALAGAYLLVALLVPFLSGIADYSGRKKSFMSFFCYLGGISCSCMYFFDSTNIGFGLLMAAMACIGFSGSLVFYNAFLPEIASPEDQDHVSARGFSMGYWGSSILLLLCLTLINSVEGGQDKLMMMRYSFVLVGVWWIGFAQIPLIILPNNSSNIKGKGHWLLHGFQELMKVWSELKEHKNLIRFLPAFFVYSMGVQTVMLVATHFAKHEIGMESAQLITTILIIQFVALIGAYLFSFCSARFGNILTLRIAVAIWAGICFFTYYFVYQPLEFFIVAGLVGLVMGGIQALSRSTFSKMLPETVDHSSYFSFYDVCEKLSIVFGMLIFGIIDQSSSTMRTPILSLILFFVLGFILLQRVSNRFLPTR